MRTYRPLKAMYSENSIIDSLPDLGAVMVKGKATYSVANTSVRLIEE